MGKWWNIIYWHKTSFPTPIFIPSSTSFFITDVTWVNKDRPPWLTRVRPWHDTHSWIAGANQIHCTTQNFCGAQWASKPWFDTIHQTKQTDMVMVMAFWLEPLALYQTHDSQSTSSWSVTTATTTDNIFFLKFFKFLVLVFFTFFFMIIRSCDLNTEKTTDDKADLSTASHHVSMKAFLFSWCGTKKKYYILTEIWNQEMFSFQLPKFEWPTSLLRLHWGKEQLSNSSHRLGHTARNHSLPPMCKLNRAAEPVPLQWTTHDHKAF